MAIEDKKYDRIHVKDGNNKDTMKAKFDDSFHTVAVDFPDDWPELAAVIYQIGQLEEEIDYLRSIIDTNNSKTTFPGFGTSGSTCLAGNTTTITTAQAKEITTNTAKTGITTEQAKAITTNTAKTGISDEHLEIMETNTAKISFPACSTNVEGSTASITSFAHVYDAKANSNSLQINVTVTNAKGLSALYSTTLTLK